jgi:HNH endonuclease
MQLQERIDRLSVPEPNSGCVLWLGQTNEKGYGYITVGYRNRRVHRVVYEMAYGPLPVGSELDHLCRVRCCINVSHLEVVTGRTNTLRGIGPTSLNAAKDRCKRGHPFTPDNIRKPSSVPRGRLCRACERKRPHRSRVEVARLAALKAKTGAGEK